MLSSHTAKDDLGRTIYFPSGVLGPGYIVATEEQEERILRGYVRTVDALLVISFVALFAVSSLELPLIAIPAIVAPLAIAVSLSARLYVRGLEKSQTTLTLRASYGAMAQLFDGGMLIAAEVLVTLGFFVGALVLFLTWSWQLFVVTAIFGFCAVAFGYMIYLKYAAR